MCVIFLIIFDVIHWHRTYVGALGLDFELG